MEAGHSANIIMGVGEDDSLNDAIAMVIAAGFHADQQDHITNTESKRSVHTLEDEQKAEHVIFKPTNVAPPVQSRVMIKILRIFSILKKIIRKERSINWKRNHRMSVDSNH